MFQQEATAQPGLTTGGILQRELMRDTAEPLRLLSGTFHATTAMIWIDPGIIGGWLPAGIRFPEHRPDPHPLIIIWGAQHDVSAFPGGRFPIPWRLSYSEIITAVPDLRLDPDLPIDYDGPVTYLPRLYMNSWRAALLGRAFYGFSKAYARIDGTRDHFQAADRRGRPLLTATVNGRSAPRAIEEYRNGLIDQPVALSASGRLILARFETPLLGDTLNPVSVEIDVRPALLSWLPEIRKSVRGIDREADGAFQFETVWSLTRLA
jgi:hypothetical protein